MDIGDGTWDLPYWESKHSSQGAASPPSASLCYKKPDSVCLGSPVEPCQNTNAMLFLATRAAQNNRKYRARMRTRCLVTRELHLD